MKKSDLKTGMWVKYRDGSMRMVALNTNHGDLLTSNLNFMHLSDFDENLTCGASAMDIVEVWENKGWVDFLSFEGGQFKLLWQRPSSRTITFAEAEKILADHLGQSVVIKAG